MKIFSELHASRGEQRIFPCPLHIWMPGANRRSTIERDELPCAWCRRCVIDRRCRSSNEDINFFSRNEGSVTDLPICKFGVRRASKSTNRHSGATAPAGGRFSGLTGIIASKARRNLARAPPRSHCQWHQFRRRSGESVVPASQHRLVRAAKQSQVAGSQRGSGGTYVALAVPAGRRPQDRDAIRSRTGRRGLRAHRGDAAEVFGAPGKARLGAGRGASRRAIRRSVAPSKPYGEFVREAPPAEALASLRQLVKSLQGGAKIIRQGVDVTKAELRMLNLEIAYLEKCVVNDEPARPNPVKATEMDG